VIIFGQKHHSLSFKFYIMALISVSSLFSSFSTMSSSILTRVVTLT